VGELLVDLILVPVLVVLPAVTEFHGWAETGSRFELWDIRVPNWPFWEHMPSWRYAFGEAQVTLTDTLPEVRAVAVMLLAACKAEVPYAIDADWCGPICDVGLQRRRHLGG